jgi:hypothetical protein
MTARKNRFYQGDLIHLLVVQSTKTIEEHYQKMNGEVPKTAG